MSRLVTLKERSTTADLPLPRIDMPVSLFSDIPFTLNPDQEWVLNNAGHAHESDLLSGIHLALDGIEYQAHWSGSSASRDWRYPGSPDLLAVLRGLVLRKHAEIAKGPGMKSLRQKSNNDEIAFTQAEANGLLAAESRAEYNIGKGLLQAARALYAAGLLKEVRVTYGDIQTHPARLLIRDTVFVAEDMSITDMAYALKYIGKKMVESNQAEAPTMLVQCAGPIGARGSAFVRFEMVDFQSQGNIDRVIEMHKGKQQEMVREGQDMMSDMFSTSFGGSGFSSFRRANRARRTYVDLNLDDDIKKDKLVPVIPRMSCK